MTSDVISGEEEYEEEEENVLSRLTSIVVFSMSRRNVERCNLCAKEVRKNSN